MLFSSWQFIFLFLPASLFGFFLIPSRFGTTRKVWLFATSLFFYGYWKASYIPLLLLSTGFNYGIAELMTRSNEKRASFHLLTLGVTLNLLLLGYFKYTNFLCDVLRIVTPFNAARFNIELPLAISFFTFTQIGYLVDVHRDRSLHYTFFDYALFVVFFPHLIAGPIVRHWEIIPQLTRSQIKASKEDLGVGWTLFLIGLFKKILLADSVAESSEIIFRVAGNGLPIDFLDAWIGVLGFGLQLYFDFSGYSDMAIGLARMFGIRFPCNFDSPYQSRSIVDFWKRWHITLTRFFREYLYFPLGGNRCGHARQIMNIMVTMLLSGLWHGAGWTFLIWGGLHGFYLVLAHQWNVIVKGRNWGWLTTRSYEFSGRALTFLGVMVAWVFFKMSSVGLALKFVGSMLAFHGLQLSTQVSADSPKIANFLRKIGFNYAQDTCHLTDYGYHMGLISCVLLIAWWCPNSQQLLARHQPVLENTVAKRFQLKFGLLLALGLGFGFAAVLRAFFSATPTPFLYFNF